MVGFKAYRMSQAFERLSSSLISKLQAGAEIPGGPGPLMM
jgi:hypothetical protein